MNQAPNQLQQGQPPVHQVAQPNRSSTPAAPGAALYYVPPRPQYNYSGQNHGTMAYPPNSQVMVPPPSMDYGYPQYQAFPPASMMMSPYAPVIMGYPQQPFHMSYGSYLPQYVTPPSAPVASSKPPPQKKEKRILSLTDPDTKAAIVLQHAEQSPVPEEVQPSKSAPAMEQQDPKPIGSGRPKSQASRDDFDAKKKAKTLVMEHPKVEISSAGDGEVKKETTATAEKEDEAKPDIPESSSKPTEHHHSPTILSIVNPHTHAAVELPLASPSPPCRPPVFMIPRTQAPLPTCFVYRENIAATRSESDAKVDPETLMEKLEEFKRENAEDLKKMTYSRSFIELLREIIMLLEDELCPLSEHELKRIGIDRATMPSPANVGNKFSNSRTKNFNVSKSKDPFAPKPSRVVNKPHRKPAEKPPGPVIQRSANAWIADCTNRTKNNPWNRNNKTSEEIVAEKIEKVRKDVRGLLNKITPSTYDELSQHIISKFVWKDLDTLPTVVELIFIKAIEEPTFVGVYSELCLAVHLAEEAEDRKEETKPKRSFHAAIVRRCQNSFESATNSQTQESIHKLEEEIKEEDAKEEKNSKKLEDLRERLEELKAKEKRRVLGNIRFITHLYKKGLLSYKLMEFCMITLTRNATDSNYDELLIEFAAEFLKQVGPYVAMKDANMVPKINSYVVHLNGFKPHVTNRIKFMIMDLATLRNNGWVKKADGPKTMKEVVMDVKNEQRKDEIEREIYVANQYHSKSNNLFTSSRMIPERRPLALETKKDKQQMAFVNSHNAGSGLKKDLSLSKAAQSALAPKKWVNPAVSAPVIPMAQIMEEEKAEAKNQSHQPTKNAEEKSDVHQMKESRQTPKDERKSGGRQNQQHRHTPKNDEEKSGGRPLHQSRQPHKNDEEKSGGRPMHQSRQPHKNDKEKSGGRHQTQQSRQMNNDEKKPGGYQKSQSRNTPKNDEKKPDSRYTKTPPPFPNTTILKRSPSTATPPVTAAAASSSRSQLESPTFTPEDQYNTKEFKMELKKYLDRVMDDTTIEEATKSLIQLNNDLNNPVLFLKEMLKFCCEDLKEGEVKERQAVAHMTLQCCTQELLKNSFSKAFKEYCKRVVAEDIIPDVPQLKITLPQLVAHILTTIPKSKEIQYKHFVDGFKEFGLNGTSEPMFGLFLVEFGAILKDRGVGDDVEDIAQILSMTIDEFGKLDPDFESEQMQDMFKKVQSKIDGKKNLKELLDGNHESKF